MSISMMRTFTLFVCIFFAAVTSLHAKEMVIDKDTVWAGEITLNEDVLILPGATLTIEPGTIIGVTPSESTKTEPQYLSSYTEITVRGVLKAVGTREMPVTFFLAKKDSEKEWAGIIVDAGKAELSWCKVSGAESGLTVFKGEARVTDSIFEKNRYGVSVPDIGPKVKLERTVFTENDYGVVLLNGAEIVQKDNQFKNSKQKDIHTPPASTYQVEEKEYSVESQDKDAPYQSESLLGTVVWKDRVTINGVVRIPATSRLIIMPGTVVEFTKNDTNNDGIGENGLLVMGMLVAKGTKEAPIIFRSAEKERKMGDWDAINIYTSDGFQNLLEYVQVEDAFRALHIHFSNVLINHSIIKGNYRGLQFQESLVEITHTDIFANKHAMRARDSELSFSRNRVYNNYAGPNLFRITGEVQDNIFAGNYMDGLRVREGAFDVHNNYMVGNRYGLTVAYANFGSFKSNVLAANYEVGVISKGTDNIMIADNFIGSNGANGLSLLDSRSEIRGNHIAENGERGIGIISFSGTIEGNNLVNNKLYAMGLDGDNDIHAPNNWWGGTKDIEVKVYDRNDDANLGRVDYELPLDKPVPFTWPVEKVLTDTVWSGEVVLPSRIETMLGSTISIMPGTVVKFGKDASLWLYGKIEAIGTPEKRILFTAAEKTSEQSYWDQITTEKSSATFKYCDFENGNMALHSHFSNVEVDNCRLRNSESGFRARGGPIAVSNSLFSGNVYGMVFYLAKGVVEKNTFTKNEMGILVRAERRGGMIVRQNNIFANERYNMRMGDFNEGNNVNARNNWWGEGDPAEMIWDDFDEGGIGVVEYEPFSKTEFSENN